MNSLGSQYSSQRVKFGIIFSIVILGLIIAKSAFATMLISVACIAALISPTLSIQFLSLSFLIFFINPFFGELSNPIVTLERTLLPFIVFASGLWALYKQKKISTTLYPFFILFIVLLTTSFIGSYLLKVSIFKLVLLTLGASGIIAAFQASKKSKEYWTNWFFSLYSTIILFSIPTILIPTIGYFRNGRGFQGITNQPQALGIFITPFICYYFISILTSKNKNAINIWIHFSCIAGLIMLFLSGSRTSFLTILITVLLVSISKKVITNIINKLFTIKTLLYASFVLLLALSQLDAISEGLKGFIFKRDQGSTLSESFEQSRGFLILLQLNNIADNPFFGIGFQLASIPKQMEVVYDPYLGLPIQAPIEKGNLFTSIVEENGILGTIGFIIFFILLLKAVKRNMSPPLTAMFLGAFLTNIGEATFFSFGGMGLFVWLVVGLAYYSYKTQTD